jgi:hypothetical protein
MNPTDNLMAKIIFLKNIKKKKSIWAKKLGEDVLGKTLESLIPSLRGLYVGPTLKVTSYSF